MAGTPDVPHDIDLAEVGPELGALCGDNAMNWARAFSATARKLNINLGDDPEGWMVTWFANAIECSETARRSDQGR